MPKAVERDILEEIGSLGRVQEVLLFESVPQCDHIFMMVFTVSETGFRAMRYSSMFEGCEKMPIQCRYNKNHLIPVAYNCKEDFSQPLQGNSLRLTLIDSGCTSLRINQERCFLQTGVLIFQNPGTVIGMLNSHKLESKSITFEPDFIEQNRQVTCFAPEKKSEKVYHYPPLHLFYDFCYKYTGVLPLDQQVRPKTDTLFHSAISEMTVQPDALWCSRLRVILIELLRLSEEEYHRYLGSGSTKSSFARLILDYIHANYEKEITVQLLCEQFHTNHTTLLREFRALTGTTIGQYVLEYRLQLVREALLLTALTIDEIAIKFGFRQASYLSRVFKARTGMAPGQFRNHMASQQLSEEDFLNNSKRSG